MSTGFGKMGKQYWQNELQNMLGIQSGSMLPTDLPEYKGMANMYNSQSNQAMNRAVQMMGQRGITGGAAGQYLSNANESNMSNLSKMIQSLYQQANQRGTQAANTGLDLMKFWENFKFAKERFYAQQDQADEMAKAAQTQGYINLAKSLMGMGAGAMAGMGSGSGGGASGGVGGVSDFVSMFGNKYNFLR